MRHPVTQFALAGLAVLFGAGRPPNTDGLNLDFDRYSERFHHLVGEASKSRRLAETIVMIYRDVRRLQYAGISRSVPADIVAEHEQILDALRRRDPQAARSVMSHHVLGVHAKALEEVTSDDTDDIISADGEVDRAVDLDG